MNILQQLGQILTGGQDLAAQAQAAEEKIASATYAILGLLLVADIFLFIIAWRVTQR